MVATLRDEADRSVVRMEPTERRDARYRAFTLRNLDAVPGIGHLPPEQLEAIRVVGSVLPFKTNAYVCEQLIDWSSVPDDPIFRLTFPQREMLEHDDFVQIRRLLRAGDAAAVAEAATRIRSRLNPNPAGQASLNIPHLAGRALPGMQHKYRETVLFFPGKGQTCHAYCSYCFRWPQFVDPGGNVTKFAAPDVDPLVAYLRAHPDVTDVLVTGGDPLIMRTAVLRAYLEPLLAPDLEHVDIRIGTKAPVYWPYRLTDGDDADDLLRLFEELVAAGRHLAVMLHVTHPRELETPAARRAIRNIIGTGAVVRCQAPIIRHVNDDAAALADLWHSEVRLGAVPYYAFVERDTGARQYFELPLVEVFSLFTEAFRSVSGLARTVRGPVMSATPGKVLVDGITELAGTRMIVLKLLQARDPGLANRVFFARFDSRATWFDQLRPAPGTESAWPALAGSAPRLAAAGA
jgi:L-lysine 2,3-aminomutase